MCINVYLPVKGYLLIPFFFLPSDGKSKSSQISHVQMIIIYSQSYPEVVSERHLTPYMAGKVMCLLVDQQHTVNAFSLNFLCSLPLSEYIIC
jgi:hypothetical protein